MDEQLFGVGARIAEVRGERAQDAFAEHLGVSLSSVRRYEKDERPPDSDFLFAMRRRESVSSDWLLYGEGSRRRGGSFEPDLRPLGSGEARPDHGGALAKIRIDVAGREHWVSPDEYRWIPVLNVKVTGGHGATIREENVIAFNAYRRDWLQTMGLLEAVLSEVTVANDESMYPELRRGDTLLVNHSQSTVSDGAIYILRQGENLNAKYLQMLPGNKIQVVSRNTENFPTFEIGPEDFASGDFEIVGQVVRQGRNR